MPLFEPRVFSVMSLCIILMVYHSQTKEMPPAKARLQILFLLHYGDLKRPLCKM